MRTLNAIQRKLTCGVIVLAGALLVFPGGCKKSEDKGTPTDNPSEMPTGTPSQPTTQTPPPSGPSTTKPEPNPPTGAMPGGGAEQPTQIDEKMIDKFVAARKKALEVQASFRSKLASVREADEARKLQKQASEEIRKAVEATGLDFNTFVRISRQLQSDQSLQKKVEDRLKQDVK